MNQMKDIDQTACGNTTDSADGSQLMSHSHAEKELKANENTNLILNKTSH